MKFHVPIVQRNIALPRNICVTNSGLANRSFPRQKSCSNGKVTLARRLFRCARRESRVIRVPLIVYTGELTGIPSLATSAKARVSLIIGRREPLLFAVGVRGRFRAFKSRSNDFNGHGPAHSRHAQWHFAARKPSP